MATASVPGAGHERQVPALRQTPRRGSLDRPVGKDRRGQSATYGKRVVPRIEAAHPRTECQTRPLAESAPLHLEDDKARDEGDADNQCTPIRNQTRARAIRSRAGEGDGSAPAGRDPIHVRRPARARRQGGNHARGKQGSR